MIYVISKSTFGDYDVRDIQCNANWCSCPYSDYALIPDGLVEGILATKGYCDITLNSDGTEVESFTARTIPSVPEECCGSNTVLSVNGVKANNEGSLTLNPSDIDAAPSGYGLGETSARLVTSLDEVQSPGWYRKWFEANEMPAGAVHGWWTFRIGVYGSPDDLEILMESNDNWSDYSNTFLLRKKKMGGVWQDWEFVNPPMVVGVSYRTTERYKGKPVYCTALSTGEIPANTKSNINIEIFGASEIVSVYIKDKRDLGGYLEHHFGFLSGHIAYDANVGNIFMFNAYSVVWSGIVFLKYIRG